MANSDVLADSAPDVLGVQREFSCSEKYLNSVRSRLLLCPSLKVSTHDFRITNRFAPREHVRNPPAPWDKVGVSAHYNTLEVAKFLQGELEHNGLDGNGMEYASVVHYPDDNAYWIPGHNKNIFAYGKHERDNNMANTVYYAAGISIVAHEIFHGVTHFMSGLGCMDQPGALNESYSDIFGVLLANRHEPNIGHWMWEIGIPGVNGTLGFPFRSLSNPPDFNQPDHMRDYIDTMSDQGGVHINNGIHNKAAYNLLTSRDSQGNYLLDFSLAGLLFYSALRNLKPDSDFSDSRLALTLNADKCFQRDDDYYALIRAIDNAFDLVGIP